MDLQQIPRTIVNRGLDLARFPLDTVASRLAGGDDRWMVAVDRLQSGVRETAGRLLNDDQLLADAQLQRTEAAEREKAFRLRVAAERAAREGERKARAVERQAEKAQEAEERRAERVEADIERRERAAAKSAIAKRTAALNAADRALQTKATADRLEDATETAKAARKAAK